MTGIEHIALLLKHFDDVEAIRRLHNLRNHARFQGHGRIREGRPENRLGCHAEFATLAGAARVFGIDTGQRREFFPVDDPLPERQQLFFYSQFRGLAVRVDANLAQLVFLRDHRQVIHRCGVQILFYLIRRQIRNLRGNLGLFLLGEAHVFKLFAPLVAELIDGFAEILFHLLIAAQLGAHAVDLLGQFPFYHIHIHRERVHTGLHEQEFALQHRFQQFATHVAVRRHALCAPHLDFAFNLGNGDHFTADHGHGLINHLIFLCRGLEGKAYRNKGGNNIFNFHNQ